MGELGWAGQKFTWLENIINMNSWKESSSRTIRKKGRASGILSCKSIGVRTMHCSVPAINSSLAPTLGCCWRLQTEPSKLSLLGLSLGWRQSCFHSHTIKRAIQCNKLHETSPVEDSRSETQGWSTDTTIPEAGTIPNFTGTEKQKAKQTADQDLSSHNT